MKLGEIAICPTPEKSFVASYGTLRSIADRTPKALATARNVRPSGFCWATNWEPTTPPAPTRLSTSTVFFQVSASRVATRRVMTSVPPPAVKGTTIRICGGGKSAAGCAGAAAGAASATAGRRAARDRGGVMGATSLPHGEEGGRGGGRESGRAGEREGGRAGGRESGRAGEREGGRRHRRSGGSSRSTC